MKCDFEASSKVKTTSLSRMGSSDGAGATSAIKTGMTRSMVHRSEMGFAWCGRLYPTPRETRRSHLNIRDYNRRAWDRQVETGNRWTVPVGPEVTAAARQGEWSVVLTPSQPVPRDWCPT